MKLISISDVQKEKENNLKLLDDHQMMSRIDEKKNKRKQYNKMR